MDGGSMGKLDGPARLGAVNNGRAVVPPVEITRPRADQPW
jgi:hypothetical protein